MPSSTQPLSPWWIFGALGLIALAALLTWAFDAFRAWRKGRIHAWWRTVENAEGARCQLANLCTCPDYTPDLCQRWPDPGVDPAGLVVKCRGLEGFTKGAFAVRERLFPPARGYLGDPLFPPVAGNLHSSAGRRLDALRVAS